MKKFALQTYRNTCVPTRDRWNDIRSFLKTRGIISKFYSSSATSQIVKFSRALGIDAGSDPRDDVHDFMLFLKEVDVIFSSNISRLWQILNINDLEDVDVEKNFARVNNSADVKYLIVYGEKKALPRLIHDKRENKYFELQSVCIQIISFLDLTFHVIALAKCQEKFGHFLRHAASSTPEPEIYDVFDSDIFGFKSGEGISIYGKAKESWTKLVSTKRSRFVAIYAQEKYYNMSQC